ncbi:FkbM family methyltransferase [Haloterrigena alkaliphila]|uniref:FkbM family methyltransferase n=1 Tax=Haloterrigena alkaliphila TaxID=2816475 RepID=A0A8A2VC57_9EURY|nr:FkbM family methyltransferase [Haloterrigena alkaliphila]QSW98297.1 FkbM family methyltransferase [Haloterrigena alkaliphila]
MSAIRPLANRLRSAGTSTERIAQYVRLEAQKLGCLLRMRRPGAFVGSVAELLTGRNPYYAARLENGRYQRVDVKGYELVVDTADAGISRTLLAYGVHEYRSTRAFERELERLAAVVDGPVRILEVGANIGYFALVEAAALDERVRIHAVEPVPSNVDLLEHNLERNDLDGCVDVDRLAFGAERATVEMDLSTHSNQHRVRDSGPSDGAGSDDTVTVEQTTGDRYLAERDVDPASVNVVRFDVEGYEREVLEGLSDVLAAPGPTVVFVELHPLELSPESRTAIVDRFVDHGFEVVSAVRTDAAAGVDDERRWHGLECGVDDFDDLRRAMAESDHSIELVARK